MNTMKTHTIHTTTRRALPAVLATLALATTASHAAIVISFQQVGANVVETGSGSANLTALTLSGPFFGPGQTFPNVQQAIVGPSASGSAFTGVSGPSNFGLGGGALASSNSGNTFGLVQFFAAPNLYLPTGYVSGSALSGSSTFNGQTFASLGITPGTYLYTWGAGPTADSLTVQAIAAPVPEPGSALAGLLALGACAGGLFRRNRQTERAASAV